MSKVCFNCQQARHDGDYSNAQLKKKGKRVCSSCVQKNSNAAVEGDRQAHDDAVYNQQQQEEEYHHRNNGIAASSNNDDIAIDIEAQLRDDAIKEAARVATNAANAILAAAPPNVHFPSQSPVHIDYAPAVDSSSSSSSSSIPSIAYYTYSSERQLPLIQSLIEADLSEPYSIFTYRYFLNFWPDLTFLAMVGSECIGCILCRLSLDKVGLSRGYIAMLAVSTLYRHRSIGSRLVKLALTAMQAARANLVVLEAEVTNKAALRLYEKLNFVRETRLLKYYLSGSDAFRLKLWLPDPPAIALPTTATTKVLKAKAIKPVVAQRQEKQEKTTIEKIEAMRQEQEREFQ